VGPNALWTPAKILGAVPPTAAAPMQLLYA